MWVRWGSTHCVGEVGQYSLHAREVAGPLPDADPPHAERLRDVDAHGEQRPARLHPEGRRHRHDLKQLQNM